MSQASPIVSEASPAPAVADAQGLRGGAASNAPDVYAALEAAHRVTARHAVSSNQDLTPYERALPVLLDALQWSGQTRHLIAALPHVDPIADRDALAATLERLGYAASFGKIRLDDCHPSKFPVFFEDRNGAWVALGRDALGVLTVAPVFSGDALRAPRLLRREPPARAVDALSVAEADRASSADDHKIGWVDEQLHALRDPLMGALCLTFLINIFAIAAPLFSMAVYNTLIPSAALEALLFTTAIVGLALLAEDFFRGLRGRLMASFAGQLHQRIMQAGLRKLFSLPIEKIEAVSSTAQLAQLRRFESIVTLFQGAAAATLFDLPFVLIFLILIALIAGPLALIPLVVALVFAALSVIWFASLRRAEIRLSEARRNAQELLRETVIAADEIRGATAQQVWRERLCNALGVEAEAVGESVAAQQMSAHIAQLVTALAATAMLAAGALLAVNGDLSVGALIAVIMLMWKVLAPFQSAFLSLGQLRGFREDVRMTNQLMRMPDEAKKGGAATIHRRFEGAIAFAGVGFRYGREPEFALRNVSFKLEPGERLGVMGGAGAGRGTLIRLAMGLYQPTIGAITVDGLPLSQLDMGELRAAFAFAPRKAEFFYGTIAQNIRLARNDVSDDEIAFMLDALDQPLEAALFPEGAATRLTARARAEMGPAVLQKLNNARALLSHRPFLLMEEPTSELDKGGQAAFVGQLTRSRGDATTIITSNRRDILAACDKVMVLARGQVVRFGAPAEVFAPEAKPGGGSSGAKADS